MRVLICGDRHWTDYVMIADRVATLPKGSEVIEGEAKGADLMARRAAEQHGLLVLSWPAEWDRYGRAAGPVRNQRMLKEGRPEEVWAFHDDLANSKGTKDMVRQAQKMGVPVKVFSHTKG